MVPGAVVQGGTGCGGAALRGAEGITAGWCRPGALRWCRVGCLVPGALVLGGAGFISAGCVCVAVCVCVCAALRR